MQCGAYQRPLWTSRHVSKIGALEATYCLVQPWLQLIGTFVYPVPAIVFLANYLAGPTAMQAWVVAGGWMILAFYLVVGLGPFVLWGPLYCSHCEPGMGRAAALALGVGYSLFVLIFYVTSWRAFSRILGGRTDWSKTRRNAEFLSELEPPVQPAPAGARQMINEMMGENS
jgi:1,2-diacylglycerol 3-beta-glucosyltransferase